MSYEEKRVRVKNYGTIPKGSPLLVDIPGVGGKSRKLHKLAAAAFARMSEAVAKDLGIQLAAASGWRRHRWKSHEQYEEFVKKKYGSVREGRKWLAYSSPHETGLAVDIGVGGLEPSRKTRAKQKQTRLHQWLVEHAWEYGWHPYKVEPWHWEHPLSKKEWETGEPDDEPPPEDDGESDEADDVTEDEIDDDDD